MAAELSLPDGVRSTAQRVAVVRAVAESTGSFTVADLHERARRLEPGLGLATTYRTIELLRASGGVHPLLGEGRPTYVRCRPEHHHHLVCTSCGGVEETELCAAPSPLELQRQHGFRPAAPAFRGARLRRAGAKGGRGRELACHTACGGHGALDAGGRHRRAPDGA